MRDNCCPSVKSEESQERQEENRENSSRMEAHDVAPDVVDVAPADVISFTQVSLKLYREVRT